MFVAGRPAGVLTMIADYGSGEPLDVIRRGSNAVAALESSGSAEVILAGPTALVTFRTDTLPEQSVGPPAAKWSTPYCSLDRRVPESLSCRSIARLTP